MSQVSHVNIPISFLRFSRKIQTGQSSTCHARMVHQSQRPESLRDSGMRELTCLSFAPRMEVRTLVLIQIILSLYTKSISATIFRAFCSVLG